MTNFGGEALFELRLLYTSNYSCVIWLRYLWYRVGHHEIPKHMGFLVGKKMFLPFHYYVVLCDVRPSQITSSIHLRVFLAGIRLKYIKLLFWRRAHNHPNSPSLYNFMRFQRFSFTLRPESLPQLGDGIWWKWSRDFENILQYKENYLYSLKPRM